MNKRYHVLVVREDGKQYQNRILEWFQVRKNLTLAGILIGTLLLGTCGFIVLAAIQGNMVRHNIQLSNKERRLRQAFVDLGKDLNSARLSLSKSKSKLSQMEEMARQQHLKLNATAGVGGSMEVVGPTGRKALKSGDENISGLTDGILDLKEQVNFVYRKTQDVSRVLGPRLEAMAHTPSVWPVKGFISSGFGERGDPFDGKPEWHEGIDIAAHYGSIVRAPAKGLVVFTGWRGGYGNCIEISHGYGISTRYAHLSKILVKDGAHVNRYQPIGRVGSTGRSTGPHLHYEVRRNGRPVNPKRFLLY